MAAGTGSRHRRGYIQFAQLRNAEKHSRQIHRLRLRRFDSRRCSKQEFQPHECHHCGACPTVWGACRHPRAFSWRRSLFTRTIEPSLRGASEVRAAFLPAYCEHATLKSVKAGRGVGFFGLKLPVDGGCAGVKVRCPKMKEGQASLEHGHPRRVL